MRKSLLDLLWCPMGCQSDLRLAADADNERDILTGRLECPGCGRRWPIEEGIPRLLPDALAPTTDDWRRSTDQRRPDQGTDVQNSKPDPAARQRSEMAARDAQAGDYDRMWHLNLFGLVEVPITLLNMDLAGHHVLLEGGCGTGRMTRQFAARCREQVSVDFSWESLRACKAKLESSGVRNVHLVQADLCHLPFRSDCFDRVVSCQVLEHIPSQSARASAVRDLARVLRPGGNLTLSAYQYSLLMRLFGEKEGEHAGGIYFFRFTRDELSTLLEPWVHVESMTGALVYHYIARCRKREMNDDG